MKWMAKRGLSGSPGKPSRETGSDQGNQDQATSSNAVFNPYTNAFTSQPVNSNNNNRRNSSAHQN